jgi:hypothetical protein
MLDKSRDYKKEMPGRCCRCCLKICWRWLFSQVFSRECFRNLSIKKKAIEYWLGWPQGVRDIKSCSPVGLFFDGQKKT